MNSTAARLQFLLDLTQECYVDENGDIHPPLLTVEEVAEMLKASDVDGVQSASE